MKTHTSTAGSGITQINTEQLKEQIIRHLHSTLGTDVNKASPQAW